MVVSVAFINRLITENRERRSKMVFISILLHPFGPRRP